MPSPLEDNLRAVRNRLTGAAVAVGRSPADVQILPVTKTVDEHVAHELWSLGEHELAENRVDGFERKAAWFAERGLDVTWHFIGHIQSNKARRIAALADVIHSVDSPELVAKLDSHAHDAKRRIRIYLQVNLTGESAKYGMTKAQLADAIEACRGARALDLLGLMAMGPLTETATTTTESVFALAAELAAGLEQEERMRSVFDAGRVRLSLGMSGDLEAAVRAGSNVVRVGSALFDVSAMSARDNA